MKKWILRIFLALLGLFLLLGFIPFSKQIHYSGTAYEFTLAQDSAVAEHNVVIDGTYSSCLFLKDCFWGTFYVSGVEGLTEDMHVNWRFEPNRWHLPYFLDYAGQPHMTKMIGIYFDRNFEQVALQLATKYEKDGNTLKAGADQDTSNFLVIGALNKEEALNQYTRMRSEKQ